MAAVAAASGSEEAAAPEPTPAPGPACPLATLDPQLLMAALRGNTELLKHLLQLKDEKEQEECPQATLDPQLLMAARHGDSERLKDLLQIKEEEKDANTVRNGAILETKGVTTNERDLLLQVADSETEVDDAPPPPVEPLAADGVTIQGDSLLQVADSKIEVDNDDRRSPSPSSASHDDDHEAPPSPPVVSLDVYGVTIEGDSLLHVVAACGDGNNFLECAEMSYDKANRLLVARNTKGDTPLHCAAGAGNANMISCLISLADRDVDTSVEALVRMRNKCGETALQQAVRAPHNNEECINLLMAVDSDLACIPPEGEGSSALYLAISTGDMKMAGHLYAQTKSRGKLSYSGPDGTNVLHAAVCRGQGALRMVLRWLRKAADMQQREGHADPHLLSQLTSQGDKENGSTPLHLAASLGGLPSPNVIMHKTHPYVWGFKVSPATVMLLLDANKSTAYHPDKRGLYPIHVAAGAGRLHVVTTLLSKCPDCATLRDAKGRTFFHVAVEEGCYNVVKYVSRQSIADAAIAPLLPSVLNAQDINGDTALHRAVRTGFRRLVFCVARNQMVRLDVKNKEGLTPIDVAWTKMPLGIYYAWDSRIHIRNHLLKMGAPYGKNRGDLFHQSYILPKQDEDEMSKNLATTAQVLGLFSVLMTTATFASAFTLPGGYLSAGDAAAAGRVAGTPVLAGSYAFRAFVLSNALAFLCSLLATSLLLYAGVPYASLTQRFGNINLAYTLMWQAARCLLAAFALGLYVVLSPVALTIAIVVLVLVILSGVGFIKDSEGIHSMIVIARRRRLMSRWEFLLHWIIFALDRFWSYIIIFSLAAIHKRAK